MHLCIHTYTLVAQHLLGHDNGRFEFKSQRQLYGLEEGNGVARREEVNQLLISSWWTDITLSAAEMLAMRSVLHPGCR